MAFNKKFYAGSFCSYKASKIGYYQVSGLFRVSAGKTSKSEDMLPYTLPTVSFSNPTNKSILTFSQGMLPDYTILPAQVCLVARAGVTYLIFSGNGSVEVNDKGVLDNVEDNRNVTNYYFFIKDGKPLLSLSSNVANAMCCGRYKVTSHTLRKLYKINCETSTAQFYGINVNQVSITSGYMDSYYTFPDQNTHAYECDIILKIKTGSSVTGLQKLLKFGGFWFGINDGKFAFAALSTVVNGATATADKSYWFRVMQTGSDVLNYSVLYLEDDGSYTIDTLPGVGQWQIGAYGQFGSCAAHNAAIRFSDMTNPWGGTIDLLNCQVCIKYVDASSWTEVWHAIDVIN